MPDTPVKKKLVIVWNYVEWGGAQVYLLAIMKAAKNDWDVTVVLPKASQPAMVALLEQIGVRYDFSDLHLDLSPAIGFFAKVRRQARRVLIELQTFRRMLSYPPRSTVFHLETAPWQSVALLTALSLSGRKVFVTLHNFLPKASAWREMLWRSRLQFVSRLPGIHLFASNNDTKNRLKGWVSPSFWDDIKVTFTAVDPKQIDETLAAPSDRNAILQTHDIPTNKFIVLCVGQFIDRKGRWTFLEAAAAMRAKDPDVFFVWLTPTAPDSYDQRRIDDFDVGDNFRWILSERVGTERADVLRFFRIADVFTLPSFVEGLPIALLEAMALERPSISTNVYAIPEAVMDMDTGILIEAGDSAALVRSILRLKNDPELRSQLAAAGRKHVIASFDENDAARIAVSAYEEALGAG